MGDSNNLEQGAGRRRTRGRKTTLKAKTLRRMLKKKGMKTTGKKATLMKRLHMKGGSQPQTLSPAPFAPGGDNTMGPPSAAGNFGEPGLDYAARVSGGLSRQSGGRRRRRRSSSSSR
jgi:hypothetical protein